MNIPKLRLVWITSFLVALTLAGPAAARRRPRVDSIGPIKQLLDASRADLAEASAALAAMPREPQEDYLAQARVVVEGTLATLGYEQQLVELGVDRLLELERPVPDEVFVGIGRVQAGRHAAEIVWAALAQGQGAASLAEDPLGGCDLALRVYRQAGADSARALQNLEVAFQVPRQKPWRRQRQDGASE